MKRENLQKFVGKRLEAKAKIERFGCISGSDGSLVTLLLTDIYVTDGEKREFLDHVWIRINKNILNDSLNLQQGDYIDFKCSVGKYYKAPDYDRIQGYRLKKISNVIVSQPSMQYSGVCVREFIENMRDIGKVFAPEYKAVESM